MSFVATPSTAFVTGHQLTPETANYWRVAISQAMDGTGGGTYTPTAPIIIGGAQGLRIGSGGVFTVLSGGSLSANVGSTVTLAGTNTLNGTNTLSGTNTVSGATTISGAVTKSGTGATWRHRVSAAPDATSDLDTSYDYYIVPATLTGNRDYTLQPASDGMLLGFVRNGTVSAHTVRIYKEPGLGGDLLAQFPDSVDCWAQFIHASGAWTVLAWGGGTTV